MTDLASQRRKEEISIIVNAVLRRGHQGLLVFSGRNETGIHVRVVAPKDIVSKIPSLGELWKIKGDFRRDSVYGVQFYADCCEKVLPQGRLVILYIANNPSFKGLGLCKAKKLYSHFGDGLIQILNESNVARLEEVLTPLAAKNLVNAWRNDQAETEVVTFLDRYKFTPRLASKVWRCWGDKAVLVLERNPYSMLAFAGWEIVDRAARQLGVNLQDERRLIGAVESCLYARLTEKHTLTDHLVLIQRIRYLIGVDAATAERAVRLALNDMAIVGTEQDGYQPIGAASSEYYIAKRLALIQSQEAPRQGCLFDSLSKIAPPFVERKISEYESSYGIKLNEEQRNAVRMAVTKPLGILTGGAGVGKTTVLKIVIDIIEDAGGTVYQMALSGRAAQRMREATGHEASTIAMFIRNVQKGHLNIEAGSLIIIDESSMLDLPVMHRVIRNLPDSVRLLMVGDPYQLPPIGFGLVFHKFAKSSSVPRVELTQVHRQAEVTGIPSVALSVRNGVVPHLGTFNSNEMGVSFIDCSPEQTVGILFDVSKSWGRQTDTQILGVLKSGDAGVRKINEYFHRANSALWKLSFLISSILSIDLPIMPNLSRILCK